MRRGRRLGARSTLLRGQSRGHVSGRFLRSVPADLGVPLPHVREHVHRVPPDEPVLDAGHLPRWARRHRPPPWGGRCHALRIRNPGVDPGPVGRRVLRGRLRLRGTLIVAAATLVEQLLDDTTAWPAASPSPHRPAGQPPPQFPAHNTPVFARRFLVGVLDLDARSKPRHGGLLDDPRQDRCQARLGPGARRSARQWAAHPGWVWLSSGLQTAVHR